MAEEAISQPQKPKSKKRPLVSETADVVNEIQLGIIQEEP